MVVDGALASSDDVLESNPRQKGSGQSKDSLDDDAVTSENKVAHCDFHEKIDEQNKVATQLVSSSKEVRP